MAQFGVNVVEGPVGSRPVQAVDLSTVGVVGTAGEASATGAFGDGSAIVYNKPFLLTKRSDAQESDLGADGTLPEALNSIYAQGNVRTVMIIVQDGEAPADTASDDEEAAELADLRTKLAGAEAELTGVYALLRATGELGVKPRIICTPSDAANTRVDGAANAVATALVVVAEKSRAVAVVDLPSTDITEAVAFAGDFGSDRAYLVDPKIRTIDGITFASPAVAGLMSANDARRGFWTEPANQIIQGVLGTAIPIDFEMGSSSTRAQTLNDSNIATIVNFNGNRLWGARIASTAGKYIFLSTRRIMDSVIDSIQTSFGGAVMQPITRGFLTNVAESVNGFLRGLQSKRAIYGGNCWADGELNTENAILQGKVFFNVALTPVYPAEAIQFTVELTSDFAIQV